MVSRIVTGNIEALKNAPQTFESIYTIIKNSFTSETFGEWLENGEVCKMSYYELYERADSFSKAAVTYAATTGSLFSGDFCRQALSRFCLIQDTTFRSTTTSSKRWIPFSSYPKMQELIKPSQ